MSNDRGAGYLAGAEATLSRYEHDSSMISDESYLLRGCLLALVAIGMELYKKEEQSENSD